MRGRGLFLDRDGVINQDDGYIGSRDRLFFLPGVFAFLRAAQDRGYKLAILTNQSGVGRGLFTREAYDELTASMLATLAREGIAIALVLACFEHPDATLPAYRRESFWRKPRPGMVLEAAARLRLDVARSAFLGDSPRDMEAAAAAGVGTRLLLAPSGTPTLPADLKARTVRSFDEALKSLENPYELAWSSSPGESRPKLLQQ